MASTRGREVLRGRLYYRARKSNGSQKKKRVVAAFSGMSSSSEGGKTFSAQMQIFDDYEKIEKPGYKPKGSIKLDNAKIESSYSSPAGSNTSSPAYTSTVLIQGGGVNISSSPSLSMGSTNSQSGSTPSLSVGSTGGSNFGPNGGTDVYIFTVATSSGEVYEFRTDSENDRLRWVKLLQLLVMYPYSQIPEEPQVNPIKDSFRQALEAKQYNADSVWPVYILHEEVGHKCGIIGQHILALRSGVPNVSMGTLDIISPADHNHAVVTWDRDKMRRTGKTGHLVFIEIGRRCEGGPGLVWMYVGYQNDAQALRETLHRFLFQGDGSAVTTNSQPQNLYDVPRSSQDSHHSFQKRPSASYQNNNLIRGISQDHDSGYHSVDTTTSSLDGPPVPILDGPPVRLDKHPSVRRKRDSEVSLRSNSIVSASSPYGSLELDLFEYEEGSILGHSPADDNEGYITGDMDADSESTSCGQRLYDTVGQGRSHSICSAQAMPDNEDSQYMRMMNPASTKEGTYVYMRSASLGSASKSSTMPVPMPHAGGAETNDEYNILQHHPPNGRPTSRQLANSLNYETLPTINESRQGPIPIRSEGKRGEGLKNYENHPQPQDLKDIAPRVYRPSYENHDSSTFRGRRGSHGKESYENVSSQHYQTPRDLVECKNFDGNNNAVKRTSLRRCGEREVSQYGGHSSVPPLKL